VDILGPIIAIALVAGVVALVVRTVHVTTIHDYERGLRFRQGRLVGLVDPGVHVTVGPLTELHALDVRPAMVPVEGQEILTADGVAAKVSLVARYVVGDPVAAISNDQDYLRALHIELQLGLRDAIAAATLEELLAGRGKIGPGLMERAASPLARVGIELLGVEVRDLMVPGELKRLFAGVVAARKEGEASLERVRAETAALRSLANAGRMVEDNPGLLQLRMLQQVGGSTGNTVLLSMPDGHGGPVPPATNGPASTEAARRAKSQAPDPESRGG
jgi:regulator of protease activity HflC (stomatin/prohibitin superfamily)